MPQAQPQAPAQASSTGSLDPDIVALAKAVRQKESGGNPNAKGASGEYGAYQWEPGTWDAQSKAAGVNVPLQQSTLAQQNEVWYKWAKAEKDSGKSMGQIISMQNAGEGEPNAYLGTFADGSPSKGTNKQGVSFDVPSYAEDVAKLYHQYKGDSVNTSQPQSDQNADFLDKARQVLTSIFPGTEQIGEALGTAAYNIGQLPSEFGKLVSSAPGTYKPGFAPVDIPKQIGGTLEAGSLVAAPEAGAGSALGRIGTTAALGATAGAGNALAQGGNLGDTAKGAVQGGLIGGALGGAGELVSKAAQYLPYRLARSFLPGTNPETVQYAIQKGLGTPVSMLNRSDRNLTQIGSQIEDILGHEKLAASKFMLNDILPDIQKALPDANIDAATLTSYLKGHAPLVDKLIDKLGTEGLNAKEFNRLKSAIGRDTYKTRFDDPAVKAGKDVGAATYRAINDKLKTTAPELAPAFDEYSKELQLNSALERAKRTAEKSRPLTLRDILAFMTGTIGGGGVGGLGLVALERGLTSPSINLPTAGLISKLASPAAGALGRTGLVNVLGQQSPGQSQ